MAGRPEKRIVAKRKNPKPGEYAGYFDLFAGWPAAIGDGEVFNLVLDSRSQARVRARPRDGGEPVTITSEEFWIQFEPNGAGGKPAADDDDDGGDF